MVEEDSAVMLIGQWYSSGEKGGERRGKKKKRVYDASNEMGGGNEGVKQFPPAG